MTIPSVAQSTSSYFLAIGSSTASDLFKSLINFSALITAVSPGFTTAPSYTGVNLTLSFAFFTINLVLAGTVLLSGANSILISLPALILILFFTSNFHLPQLSDLVSVIYSPFIWIQTFPFPSAVPSIYFADSSISSILWITGILVALAVKNLFL